MNVGLRERVFMKSGSRSAGGVTANAKPLKGLWKGSRNFDTGGGTGEKGGRSSKKASGARWKGNG